MSVKMNDGEQLRILGSNTQLLCKAIVDGFLYDPGHSDLDNEQPINVRMTLGDYRRASGLLYELNKNPQPHASDCAHWVGEPCDCITGKNSR